MEYPKIPVALGVVSLPGEQWGQSKGYSHYWVSTYGRVFTTIQNKLLTQSKSRTSVGSYLTVTLRKDTGKIRTIGVHILVARVWLPPPPNDGKKYEVNHLDGDKHNNHKTNLEWSTRLDNIKHAIITGLRKNNNTVVETNVVTGEVREYYSVREFCKQRNISRSVATLILRRHGTIPLNGKYTYRYDLSNSKPVARKESEDLYSIDHVTGDKYIASNAFMLEVMTHVNKTTISKYIREGNRNILAGYSFRKLTDPDPQIPVISSTVAAEDRHKYFSKNIKAANSINVNY